VSEDETCVTFSPESGAGVLQISAARKASPVTAAEAEEFARDRIGRDARIETAAFGPFRGCGVNYEVDGEEWREWWVYAGALMIYATYAAPRADDPDTLREVLGILATLRPL
jgi:hypothetical protein